MPHALRQFGFIAACKLPGPQSQMLIHVLSMKHGRNLVQHVHAGCSSACCNPYLCGHVQKGGALIHACGAGCICRAVSWLRWKVAGTEHFLGMLRAWPEAGNGRDEGCWTGQCPSVGGTAELLPWPAASAAAVAQALLHSTPPISLHSLYQLLCMLCLCSTTAFCQNL